MTKKRSIILAMSGAALVTASQAQAQFNYLNGDLLLSFRDYGSYATVPDVTVNLGPISTFSALTGTTVLDNGANNGYTPVFAASELLGVFNATANPTYSGSVGFTAAATTSGNDTSWVTRVQSLPGINNAPTTPSGPVESGNVNTLTAALLNIGNGAVGTSGTSFSSLDASGAIVSVGSAQQLSYQGSATAPSTPSQLDYNGAESVAGPSGGLLESVSTSGSTVYSALWEVPVSTSLKSGHTAADTYLGYFSFDAADDIISFTSVNAAVAVPEPATYGVLAGAGLLVLALRRQLRALNA
jgi:PEP-CTERM motif-containing protein